MKVQIWMGSLLAGALLVGGVAMTRGVEKKAGGTIEGKVTFKGGRDGLKPQHVPKRINTGTEPKCTKRIGGFQARVNRDGGGLAYTMVSIKNAPAGDYPVPSTPAHLDQKDCEYVPHVLGMMKGQQLDVKNSDALTHNIHGLPKRNREFNRSQVQQNKVDKWTFDQLEYPPFFIKCDVHPWMGAYCGVFDHPFFSVSAADGTFKIENVPPGEYTLEFWHETFKTKTVTVKVADGGSVTADLEYSYDDEKPEAELAAVRSMSLGNGSEAPCPNCDKVKK